jgi:hypothetical protein
MPQGKVAVPVSHTRPDGKTRPSGNEFISPSTETVAMTCNLKRTVIPLGKQQGVFKDMSGKTEGEVLKAVDDALSAVDEHARKRVLDWANAKFSSEVPAPTASKVQPTPAGPPGQSKAPTPRRPKTILKQVKDLNLRPKGKASAVDFVRSKAPTNHKQKCTVAIYYISNTLEIGKVGVAHVYTFFKEVNWPVPSDLLNTLHQTGSEGWLDTSDAEDIKVTTRGENLIEHQLSAQKAKD